MNKNTTEGNLKESRGKPTNDRLEVIAAKRDQLEGEIQQAYNLIMKDAAENQGSLGSGKRGLQALLIQKMLH